MNIVQTLIFQDFKFNQEIGTIPLIHLIKKPEALNIVPLLEQWVLAIWGCD